VAVLAWRCLLPRSKSQAYSIYQKLGLLAKWAERLSCRLDERAPQLLRPGDLQGLLNRRRRAAVVTGIEVRGCLGEPGDNPNPGRDVGVDRAPDSPAAGLASSSAAWAHAASARELASSATVARIFIAAAASPRASRVSDC
jgi:hypothetical protein